MAIGFFAVPTHAARPACVPCVHQDHGNPDERCLVLDLRPELGEGPGHAIGALVPTNRDTLPNTGEVFEGKGLAGTGCLDYYSFADAMVRIPLKTGFFPLDLAKPPPGAFCADRLERRAATGVVVSDTLDLAAAERFSLAVDGELYLPHVHAQDAAAAIRRRGLAALGDVQEVGPVAPHQVGTAGLPVGVGQHGALPVARQHPADHTTRCRVERNALQGHQSVGAGVVADAAARAERGACGAGLGTTCLDSLHSLGPGATSELRAQTEPGASLSVDPVVRRVGVGDPLIPAHRRDPGGGLVEGGLGGGQCRGVVGNVQLDADGTSECLTHKNSIAHRKGGAGRVGVLAVFAAFGRAEAIPLRLESRSLLARKTMTDKCTNAESWEKLERLGRQWEEYALRSVALAQLKRLVALENQVAAQTLSHQKEQ